jgi:hypothetical protein
MGARPTERPRHRDLVAARLDIYRPPPCPPARVDGRRFSRHIRRLFREPIHDNAWAQRALAGRLGLRDALELALAAEVRLEFGEHAQHIEEALAGGGAGVEMLPRRIPFSRITRRTDGRWCERQQSATAPITCGSPRREGGRRLCAGGYALPVPRPSMRRPDGDRVRRRLLERAIDAGARDLPHPRDARLAITASQGGRECLAHRLDLLWAKGRLPSSASILA